MDIFMRSLSLYISANEFAKHISDEELATIQAYADGVNAYVAQSTILPLEFWLTGTTFERWTIEHSFMIAKLMEFHLSASQAFKSVKTYIAETVGTEFLKEIVQVSPEYLFYDPAKTVITEEDINDQRLLRTKPHTTEFTQKNIRNISNPPIDPIPPKSMSDSWTIKGEYTKSGKPLLANDPHLTHKMPGVWYYEIFNFPNNTVVGAGLPGIPAIVIGRNTHVAWGITASGIENIDMYWLDINEKTKTYYYNNTWVPLATRTEVIKVKNGQEVRVECYTSHHGPVIMKSPIEASSIYMFGSTLFMGSPYALNWHGFRPKDKALIGAYEMMFARNTKEIIEALNNYEALPAAFIFATVNSFITNRTKMT